MASVLHEKISQPFEALNPPTPLMWQIHSSTTPTVTPETIPNFPKTVPLPPAPEPAPLTVPGMEPVPDAEPIPDQCPRMYAPTDWRSFE